MVRFFFSIFFGVQPGHFEYYRRNEIKKKKRKKKKEEKARKPTTRAPHALPTRPVVYLCF
jgi:hypothetical protein